MTGAKSARKMSMLPWFVEVVIGIILAGIVTDPAIVLGIHVRCIRVPRLFSEIACGGLLRSSRCATGCRGWASGRGSRAVRRNVSAPYLRGTRASRAATLLAAALLRESRRQTAPIAMLYSPASMRTQWLLDWQPKGDAWSARDADNDYEDASAVRSSMEHFLGLLEHRGLEPRIVTDERIGNGALRRGGLRVLILPRAIALSARAVAEIRRFAAEGGTVIADGEPGLFDEHSRRLPKPRLAALFAHAPDPATAIFGFGKGRGVYLDPTTAAPRPLDQLLTEAGVVPAFGVHRKTGEPVTDVEIYRWLNGVATILALQRDAPDHEASAATGNDAEPILLTLPRPAYVYDLRQRRLLGHMERVEVALDAASPTLLAISSTPRGLPLSSGNYRERDR